MRPARPDAAAESRRRQQRVARRALRRAFPGKGNTFYREAAEWVVQCYPNLVDGETPDESTPGIIEAGATPSTIQHAIAEINGEIHPDTGERTLWQYVARVALLSDPKHLRELIIDWLGRTPECRRQYVRRRILEANSQRFSRELRVLDDLLVFFAVLLGGADRPDDLEPLLFLHAIGGRLKTLSLGAPRRAPIWPPRKAVAARKRVVTVFPLDEPFRSLAKALADDAAALSKLRWCRGPCLTRHNCKRGNDGPLFLDRNRRLAKNPTLTCCDAHRQRLRASNAQAFKSLEGAGTPHSGGLLGLMGRETAM